MLYSSTDPLPTDGAEPDSNTYQPFRILDTTVMNRIASHVEEIDRNGPEGRLVPFFSRMHLTIFQPLVHWLEL